MARWRRDTPPDPKHGSPPGPAAQTTCHHHFEQASPLAEAGAEPTEARMTHSTNSMIPAMFAPSRRHVFVAGAAIATTVTLSGATVAATTDMPLRSASQRGETKGTATMNMLTMNDGVQIYYKDWGPRDAQPLVFHHGWPLSADDWDAQMLYFLGKGYRIVAHDRRGHGRSSQVD